METDREMASPTRTTRGPEPTRTTRGSEPTRTTRGPEPTRTTRGSEPTRTTRGPEPTRTTRGSEPTRDPTAPTHHTEPTRDPTAAAAATTHPTPSPHLVLDRYRLHRPLGAGGFGTVWLAYDERLEREVAVKMLPRGRVIGGRFEREARAAARLNHPGIVTLYEAAVDDDAAYLVSELVRGATLDELLDEGRLSDYDVLVIGIALCDALGHAHRQGVVHRDVKPSNVLVPEHPTSPAAVAKLTDFGVARVIGGNTLTQAGEVVGTAAYMAPEQAGGREADATADLYSLALVLYEALTGLNPAPTGQLGRSRRLGAHLPPLRRYRRDLPPGLGRAIDLALRPRAFERGTVEQLRAGLDDALDEVDDEPGVLADPEPPDPLRGQAAPDLQPWRAHAPDLQPLRAHQPDLQPLRAHQPDLQPPHPPPRPAPPAADEQPQAAPSFRWPARALSGAGAAVIAAWLTATAFPSPPSAPAAAAIAAGILVAALPRIGWLALTLAAALGLTAAGRSGAALLVAIGLLLPVLPLVRHPTRWPLPAAAPVLGAAILAGAWPALAGRERRVWRRAALGALGWVWLVAAGLLMGRGVYTRLPAGIPTSAQWTGSLDHTLRRVLWPVLHSGLLAPAIVWGVAAAVLPWLVRGTMPVRVVAIVIWSALLASATTTMLQALHTGVSARPGAVALGAVAGGIVALIPAFRRAPKGLSASSDAAAGLA